MVLVVTFAKYSIVGTFSTTRVGFWRVAVCRNWNTVSRKGGSNKFTRSLVASLGHVVLIRPVLRPKTLSRVPHYEVYENQDSRDALLH